MTRAHGDTITTTVELPVGLASELCDGDEPLDAAVARACRLYVGMYNADEALGEIEQRQEVDA